MKVHLACLPMCRIFCLAAVLLSSKLFASELIFAYGAGNGAPFSIIKNGQLESGLFKDIGEALAEELGIPVSFKHAPHKRTSLLLSDGTINSICMTHPDWIEGHEFLFWSDKIMEDFDHLITRNSQSVIKNYEDIRGMNIGAMTGYIYFPEFMGQFHQGFATRRDMNSLEALYSSLFAHRIDAVVDSLISVRYRKKIRKEYEPLGVSDLAVYRYDLYCAFSSSLKSMQLEIESAITRMVKAGSFEQILNRYQ